MTKQQQNKAYGAGIPPLRPCFLYAGLCLLLLGAWALPSSAQIAAGSTLEKHALPLSGDSITRTIRVWLPPSYPSQSPYPVLYLLDGQNCFDGLTAFAGEWAVDEALAEREAKNLTVPIVVGLDNGGETRIAEYSPHPHPDYGGGQAALHAQFLTQTVMPWVEDRFAVSRQASLTGLGGSSLGGLFAAFTAQQYPGRFGFVLALSPAFWFNPALLDAFDGVDPALGTRWWMAMGSAESTDKTPVDVIVGTLPIDKHAQNLLEAGNRLRRAGHPAASLHLQIDPDGEHSESYWRIVFPEAIDWWLDVSP